jgi:NADH-quinone oxidoreductase subunit N
MDYDNAARDTINAFAPSVSWEELLWLLPHEILGATIVFAMLAIAVRRHFFVTTVITTSGLIAAALAASLQFSHLAQGAPSVLVTPLFLIDAFAVFFVIVLCLGALALAILGFGYFARLDDAREEFQLLLLLATLGAVTLASSAHFVSVVIGLEMLSMALYGMIAYPIHSKVGAEHSLEAAFKYLVLSAVASATMLFGMALIYSQTGALEVVGSANSMLRYASPLALFGVMLVFVGIAFKLSLFPFHLWTPDVYEGAPLPSVTLLATLGKVAVGAFFLRFLIHSHLLLNESVTLVLALLAVASILAGNVLALRQTNLKRLLAYSSIAHMGYWVVALLSGVSLGSQNMAASAAAFYLLTYAALSLGAFACLSIASSSESEAGVLSDYRGLFWRSPWLALALSVMMFGLAGIPLTAGFIAKFQVFFAAVESSQWGLLAALVLGSAIGLFYYLRVIYQMLQPAGEEGRTLRDLGLESVGSVITITLVVLFVLWAGILPEPLLVLIAALFG